MTDNAEQTMRVVLWGTWDRGKPRNRILARGLRENAVDLVEIHADIWAGVEDKGVAVGAGRRMRVLLRWLFAYPGLIVRYLRAPPHDAVLVAYMGHLDVLVLWPFARLRGAPIVWDAFLSLYDTVVEDRKLIGRANPLAWFLFVWEWLACRCARIIVLDTRAHADYFAARYGLKAGRTAVVFVGAEPEAFPPRESKCRRNGKLTVLFYGQFIPLHGIATIVRAAQKAHGEAIRWQLVGRGQEEARIRGLLAEAPADLEWRPWVDYAELGKCIAGADICLGIFGDSDKAARVIPNKVFQILSAGAPLITRESPAIRELLDGERPGVYLVPPADPEALLDAVRRFAADRPRPDYGDIAGRLRPKALAAELLRSIRGAAGK